MSADTRTHSCPGRCGRQVAAPRFACLPCWSRLPVRLRQDISTSYRNKNGGALSAAHRGAMAAAQVWYLDNPAPVDNICAGCGRTFVDTARWPEGGLCLDCSHKPEEVT